MPRGDDRDLVHRVGGLQRGGNQRVAHLVIGHHLALVRMQQTRALLQPGDDPLDGVVEIVHVDGRRVAPRGEQCRLVDQIGEVRTGEAGRQRCHLLELHLAREIGDLLDVHVQDLQPTYLVWPVHQHLAVEAAGAQQGRVEDLGTVGGGKQHHALAGVEAVELGEQLVQRLLLLVMAAAHAPGDAGPAQGVELVDEDDAGLGLARLLEQVTHPRGTDADEHLDELGAGDGEEHHPGLAGHSPSQQGLAGARRPHQQDAPWECAHRGGRSPAGPSRRRRSPAARSSPRRRRRHRQR